MSIKVSYHVTFEENLEALRYDHRRQTIFIGLAMVTCGVLYWWLKGNWIPLPLVVLYVMAVRPYLARQRLKRDWDRKQPANPVETVYEIDAEGVHSTSPNGERTTLGWDRFLRVHESPNLFLLYLTPRLFLCVPKRAFDGADEQDARRLFRENVNPRLPQGSESE
jgi:hypothetical protein